MTVLAAQDAAHLLGSVRREPWITYREAVLAVFLTAGLLKAEPWLGWMPVDFTLLAAVATIVVVAIEFYRRSLVIPPPTFWILAFFATVLPCLLWTTWTPYAMEKTVSFFTLTLLAGVAPLFVIRTAGDLRRFLNAIVLLSVYFAGSAFYLFLTDPGRFERLGVESPISTISTGRMSGIGLVWVGTLVVVGRLSFLPGLALLALFASVLIGVGSRGPLIAACVPAVLVLALYARRPAAAIRTLALAGVLAIGLQIGLSVAPTLSVARVESFMRGEFGRSEQVRVEDVALAWDAIQSSPLGIGLGGFAARIVPWTGGSASGQRDFPHNLLLEVALEAGWVAGLAFLILVCVSVGRALRLSLAAVSRPEFGALLCILVYAVINELVSGEMNDSRLLFALMAVALVLRGPVLAAAAHPGR